MLGDRGLSLRFVIIAMLVSVIFTGLVSADTEPNNSSGQAEEIGKGTHTGSVTYNDNYDWFKVEGMGDHEVKVTVTVMSSGVEEYISAYTVDGYGITDGQIEIELFGEGDSDYCHWRDTTDRGFMYLMLNGFGDYKIKIEWGGSGGSSFGPVNTCCGSIMIGIIMVGGITAMIFFISRRK